MIYANSTAGVSVDLNVTVQHGGFAEGDQLVRIENVTGSQYGDALVGNAGVNVLDGQGGNDKIYGGDGADTLLGGDGNDFLSGDGDNDVLHGNAGNDVLVGGSGNDQVFGDAGDDVMRGGAGADAYDGGGGIDTVDYSAAPAVTTVFGTTGVLVNLALGAGSAGDSVGDTYASVENVRGSAYVDWLVGDAHDNALFGNGGADIIAGGAGADNLDGGDGSDWLDYFGSSAGVSINLATNQASGGDAAGDTIANFENVRATDAADVLIGSDVGNELHAGGANDLLVGQGGNDRLQGDGGNDVMVGGADSDTFVFYAGSDQDVILDFTVGVDHLEFGGVNFVDSLADLHFFQSGANTIMTYDNDPGAMTTLVGVDVQQLLAHAQTDFLFV